MQIIISFECQEKKSLTHYNQQLKVKKEFKGLMTEQKFSESVLKVLCHEAQLSTEMNPITTRR